MRLLITSLLAASSLASATVAAGAEPALPPGRAGEIVAKAISAAGGWTRWTEIGDVSFVSSTVYFHPLAGEVRESAGVYRFLLHGDQAVRFESIDPSERVAVALAGDEVWLEREGILVCDPPRLNLARLHLGGNLFLLALPFSLARKWSNATDAGDVSVGDRSWHRLRIEVEAGPVPELGDFFVVYVDVHTGRIDRVHGSFAAPFLAHRLWVALLTDYRDIGGLQLAHRREVFPADAEGAAVGPRKLDQIVSNVRLDDRPPASLFERPIPQPCR